MSTRQTIQRSLQKFSAFGAIAVAVMGLLGYLPGIELLGRVKEDYIPMAPSTAVSFIILGITVMILNDKQKPGVKAITFLIVTFLVSLFGILEVAGHFSGIDLNFEDALVPAAGDLNGIPIARMSPATGAAFFLSGIAVFFLILQCRFPPRKSFNEYISSGSGILVLLISFVFCLAYFYGTPLLYGQGSTVPMALTTALGFLFLSVSILIFKKDVFPLRILTGPSTRSYLLRFVLPLSTLSVILGGVAVLSAHNASKMNPAFISGALTALIAIFAGFMATLMSRHMGSKIDRSEATIKVANEELRKAEQRYRTVANFTYDWEYWEDPEGTFRYISPSCERITGYKPEEFLENPQILQKLILPEDKALWDKHRQEAINKKGTLDVQFRIRKRDGQIRWIEHVCQPVTDEKGKFLGFRASNRDITSRKHTEGEANQLREEYLHIARVSAMGELTASLAHELKQPLAAIRSNAQAAQRFLTSDKPDIDELHEVLKDIIKDNRRADDVIGKLRALMRKSELQITELNINEVVQDILPLIKSYEIVRNVSLKLEFDKNVPHVNGDCIQLQQVILNLILNSTEALMNADVKLRTIVLRTNQEDTQNVTLSVKDNGPGIKEEAMDHLFEAFYTTKQEGLGMGLTISRTIVEEHGGRLWAENNPDSGATFYFTIPVSKGVSA